MDHQYQIQSLFSSSEDVPKQQHNSQENPMDIIEQTKQSNIQTQQVKCQLEKIGKLFVSTNTNEQIKSSLKVIQASKGIQNLSMKQKIQHQKNGDVMTCLACVNIQKNGTMMLFTYKDCNEEPKLYLQIQNIGFPFLKYMNTWGNHIQSIECISNITWPSLEKICLCTFVTYQGINRIISIKSLRKVSAPCLTWLDLKENFITDYNLLSQFYNPGKRITRIHVTGSFDLAVLFKMEADSFEDIQFSVMEHQKKNYQDIKRRRMMKI